MVHDENICPNVSRNSYLRSKEDKNEHKTRIRQSLIPAPKCKPTASLHTIRRIDSQETQEGKGTRAPLPRGGMQRRGSDSQVMTGTPDRVAPPRHRFCSCSNIPGPRGRRKQSCPLHTTRSGAKESRKGQPAATSSSTTNRAEFKLSLPPAVESFGPNLEEEESDWGALPGRGRTWSFSSLPDNFAETSFELSIDGIEGIDALPSPQGSSVYRRRNASFCVGVPSEKPPGRFQNRKLELVRWKLRQNRMKQQGKSKIPRPGGKNGALTKAKQSRLRQRHQGLVPPTIQSYYRNFKTQLELEIMNEDSRAEDQRNLHEESVSIEEKTTKSNDSRASQKRKLGCYNSKVRKQIRLSPSTSEQIDIASRVVRMRTYTPKAQKMQEEILNMTLLDVFDSSPDHRQKKNGDHHKPRSSRPQLSKQPLTCPAKTKLGWKSSRPATFKSSHTQLEEQEDSEVSKIVNKFEQKIARTRAYEQQRQQWQPVPAHPGAQQKVQPRKTEQEVLSTLSPQSERILGRALMDEFDPCSDTDLEGKPTTQVSLDAFCQEDFFVTENARSPEYLRRTQVAKELPEKFDGSFPEEINAHQEDSCQDDQNGKSAARETATRKDMQQDEIRRPCVTRTPSRPGGSTSDPAGSALDQFLMEEFDGRISPAPPPPQPRHSSQPSQSLQREKQVANPRQQRVGGEPGVPELRPEGRKITGMNANPPKKVPRRRDRPAWRFWVAVFVLQLVLIVFASGAFYLAVASLIAPAVRDWMGFVPKTPS